MTELAQYCHEADYTPATGTCAAPYWGPASTGIPPLSIPDAQSIALALCLLWAVAWGFRRMAKLIDQS